VPPFVRRLLPSDWARVRSMREGRSDCAHACRSQFASELRWAASRRCPMMPHSVGVDGQCHRPPEQRGRGWVFPSSAPCRSHHRLRPSRNAENHRVGPTSLARQLDELRVRRVPSLPCEVAMLVVMSRAWDPTIPLSLPLPSQFMSVRRAEGREGRKERTTVCRLSAAGH
jgi:hypothetical protein